MTAFVHVPAVAGLIGATASLACVGFSLADAVGGADALARATSRCRPARTTTLAQSRSIRVYKSSRSRYAPTEVCMFSRNRPLAIDEPFGSTARAPFVLNGRYVAFITSIAEEEAGPYRFFLSVVDASRREHHGRLARRAGGAALDPRPNEELPDVARIALTSRAHVAWSQVSHGTVQILQLDPRQPSGSRVLDQGAGVDVRSLHLCGGSHRACWTSSGQEHSTALD